MNSTKSRHKKVNTHVTMYIYIYVYRCICACVFVRANTSECIVSGVCEHVVGSGSGVCG